MREQWGIYERWPWEDHDGTMTKLWEMWICSHRMVNWLPVAKVVVASLSCHGKTNQHMWKRKLIHESHIDLHLHIWVSRYLKFPHGSYGSLWCSHGSLRVSSWFHGSYGSLWFRVSSWFRSLSWLPHGSLWLHGFLMVSHAILVLLPSSLMLSVQHLESC